MSEHPEPELAERAAERHVVVVGGGVAGLVAARECAKVGMRVTLLEASDALGGAVRRAELDGVVLDAGAESYATRGGHVRKLVAELGLTERVQSPATGGAWLAGVPGQEPAPLPIGGILGIPANPFADDVRRVIGWRGAWRAYVDRLRPPLTIGHQRSLGRLVASRMGARVLERLVAPVVSGVYSAHPDDVDVDVAAPGLNAALTRVGSLSGAVDALRGQQQSARKDKAPGSAVEGLIGGMGTLVDALRADLEKLGGVVRTGSPVEALESAGAGWTVAVRPVEGDEDPDAADPGTLSADSAERLDADAVIVATTEDAARDLLAGHVSDLGDRQAAPQIEIVSLLLDAPELDDAPRGTGVLTVPGSHVAKALTHATAKWAWLREAAGARHVVRVSFGSQGEPTATASLDDEAAASLALTEASALLGVDLSRDQLVGAHRARFTQSQPASLLGAAERRAASRAAVEAVPGLAAVGAWLSGTGLAQVVADAAAEADRIRRHLLWD
ncbi:protoporphyrinogen oxidase [Microbacterium sp. CIAB417]|uniref:protoporphyrinogen oxidase n=1 Tax=Microbacterium sp. CIAB417 TaxID=2860287 RepID=UPI001FACF1C7|nr:protoporphyrinogen oxidase [Microbacterium sp. CIAB417]